MKLLCDCSCHGGGAREVSRACTRIFPCCANAGKPLQEEPVQYGLDEGIEELVQLLSQLPGIKVLTSCSGHGRYSVKVDFIWDNVDTGGLKAIVQQCTAEDWYPSTYWYIWLGVGSDIEEIVCNLSSGPNRGIRAIREAKELAQRILYQVKDKGIELKPVPADIQALLQLPRRPLNAGD